MIFDKTGTLTEPSIADEHRTVMLRGTDADAAFTVSAALAQGSRHPLATAFTAAGPASLPAVEARESVAGRGIGGIVDGRVYRLGRADYAFVDAAQRPELADAVILATTPTDRLPHFTSKRRLPHRRRAPPSTRYFLRAMALATSRSPAAIAATKVASAKPRC